MMSMLVKVRPDDIVTVLTFQTVLVARVHPLPLGKSSALRKDSPVYLLSVGAIEYFYLFLCIFMSN